MAKKDEAKETAIVPEVDAPKVETQTEVKTEGSEATEKAPEVPEVKAEKKPEEKAPEVQKKLDKRALKTSALVSGSLYAAGTFAHQIKAEHLELINSKYFE